MSVWLPLELWTLNHCYCRLWCSRQQCRLKWSDLHETIWGTWALLRRFSLGSVTGSNAALHDQHHFTLFVFMRYLKEWTTPSENSVWYESGRRRLLGAQCINTGRLFLIYQLVLFCCRRPCVVYIGSAGRLYFMVNIPHYIPRDRSLPAQSISTQKAQSRKQKAHKPLRTSLIYPNTCPPCLIIIQSCYFDYRINRLSASSRCFICVSCPVHVILTYYVRKGSWTFLS